MANDNHVGADFPAEDPVRPTSIDNDDRHKKQRAHKKEGLVLGEDAACQSEY
jgi:hypothetical protein